MKSICFVVQNFYDIDVRVRRKAEALVAAGYSVDVLALRSNQSQKHYVLNGVNVHAISLGKQRGSLTRYGFEYGVFFLWVLLRLPLLMLRRRYAVIDVNTLPDFLIFAPLIARWMGAKLVLDMHEITPEFFMSKYGLDEKSRMVRLLKLQERISFKFADRVLTINEPVQELLEGRGLLRSKSTIIMNAADETRFACMPPRDAASAAVSDKFVMMYHGTLTRIYGLDVAIEAFGLAHNQMPGAELWILGSGPDAPHLASLAERLALSDKVKLIGQVPSGAIPEWLRQCTVGILPIRQDVFLDFAFPNKLPECIISGKPVIISRLRTIRHYFDEEALAFFQPNDPADLAQQMQRVYSDPAWRDRLSRRAKEEYAAIRWEIMKERYLRLIASLVEPPGGVAMRARKAKPPAAAC